MQGSGQGLRPGFTPSLPLIPAIMSSWPQTQASQCLLPPDPTHLPPGQGPHGISIQTLQHPNPTQSLNLCWCWEGDRKR